MTFVEKLLDPDVKKFVDTLTNTTPIYNLSIPAARKVLNDIQLDTSYKNSVNIQNIVIENENVNATIVRPIDNTKKLPFIFYIHGGGWILGNFQTHGRLVSELSREADVAVVFINYTPAPEAKYPTQLIQSYDTLVYFYNNAEKYNLDKDNIIIMGDSVGGNMATVIAMLSLEKSGPKFKYQILLYPVTDVSMKYESVEKYSAGPWLSEKAMKWYFDAYIEKNQDTSIPSLSPINASSRIINKLPPTLIIVDENDILRDEGEAYAHKLMQAGVSVDSVRILGAIHDFMILDPIKSSPPVKLAKNIIVTQIKHVLNKN
ncbi:putative alpha/beta hydrolase [Cotonvirus japonicus]|uniref:Alpha/beta hydrolase n=1 Tax=Cotonvirus japonicus TaxID=2811091 RepID=A0ABM7NTC7_9VIRU|nr:putative alpha/beta hydrolase [Cotonvirus japonicus]BCS83327.1 putative alpha/beta hydrolase [Cotonvirus japonicus]